MEQNYIVSRAINNIRPVVSGFLFSSSISFMTPYAMVCEKNCVMKHSVESSATRNNITGEEAIFF
jgi:hypothetical protein